MKVSKNFLVALALGIVACALGGCGFIKKPMTSEATFLDRAEMATGVEKSNLSVVPDSVRSEIDSVHYKVRSKNGDIYRCYFTSALVVDSDALCTKIVGTEGIKSSKNSTKSSKDCNALLKAAGKC
ncbi:hypothetical protein [uncultured Campylobacter sp.]|uniref:hypothetical protein n=1 Tax=uncultured Campylobacter sp. TaxID=218934 RepID=UPI00260C3FED|nr:hypothetical protein [uncultured Campylobacter sp.]